VCGIAGFCLAPDGIGELNTNAIARELLLRIEERGRDATGAAWFGRGGGPVVAKLDKEASKWAPGLRMGKQTSTAILHTRLATMGDPRDNRNNHPVIAPGKRGGRVIGVHNGWVNNVFGMVNKFKLPRQATVDSEVIFTFLYEQGDDFDKLGANLDGNYACAYIREDRPNELFLIRGHSSPLILMPTMYGVFFASTEYALRSIQQFVGGPKVGFVEVAEGRAVHLKEGEIGDTFSFDMLDQWASYYGRHNLLGDDEWDTWEKGGDGVYHQKGRRQWAGNHEATGGVVSLDDWRSSSNAGANASLAEVYTDSRRGVRIFRGKAGQEVAAFLGFKEKKVSTFNSYFGSWMETLGIVDFVPWPGLGMDLDEALLEELLLILEEVPTNERPVTLVRERNRLSIKLDRKQPGSPKDGIILPDTVSMNGPQLLGLSANDTDKLPHYIKVQGVWHYKGKDSKGKPLFVVSKWQHDSDHMEVKHQFVPREGSEGDVDYASVNGCIWRKEGDTWVNTGLKDTELSEPTRRFMGLDEDVVLFPDAEVQAAVERAQAELDEVRVEVG